MLINLVPMSNEGCIYINPDNIASIEPRVSTSIEIDVNIQDGTPLKEGKPEVLGSLITLEIADVCVQHEVANLPREIYKLIEELFCDKPNVSKDCPGDCNSGCSFDEPIDCTKDNPDVCSATGHKPDVNNDGYVCEDEFICTDYNCPMRVNNTTVPYVCTPRMPCDKRRGKQPDVCDVVIPECDDDKPPIYISDDERSQCKEMRTYDSAVCADISCDKCDSYDVCDDDDDDADVCDDCDASDVCYDDVCDDGQDNDVYKDMSNSSAEHSCKYDEQIHCGLFECNICILNPANE